MIKECAKLFFMQVAQYSIVCFSYRALAQANIPMSVVVDLIYAFFMFAVVKKIASTTSGFFGQLSYSLGSALGSWVGILVSLHILGK